MVSRISANVGKTRADVGSVFGGVLRPASICATVALWVRVGGAPILPLHVGLGDGRGRFTFVHSLLAHGADATRRHLVHSDRLVSSRRKRKTLCWAAVPVCHSAGFLGWRLFKCLLRLAHVLKVFSGESLPLHEAKGHAGVSFESVSGREDGWCGLAAWTGVCGFGCFMRDVELGRLRVVTAAAVAGLVRCLYQALLCKYNPL